MSKAGAARERTARFAPLHLAVDPSGQWLSIVHRGELRLLSTDASVPTPEPLAASGVECARFDRTGDLLLSGGADKQVRLWDTRTRACTHSWTHGKKIGCVEFSADASVVMWADRFGEIYVVPLREPGAVPSLALGHLSPVSHLRLSPCATALLTADREGHVRNSLWPHPFVISNYYLAHTLPLQIVLPMAAAALVLTSSNSGREICLWRLHGGALLHSWGAAALRALCEGREAAVEDAEAEAEAGGCALEVACECVAQRLLLLAFGGGAGLVALEVETAWDACAATPRALPELALGLPSPPLAAECTAAGHLCVLLAAGVLVCPPAAPRGFDRARGALVPLGFAPDLAPLPADDADDADDD